MIKIIITSIILFIIFIIILLSLNVKIEYFNSGSNEPVISGDYITNNIDVDNIYYMFKSGSSTFTISSSIICDILVVGGGGGGGGALGGGGGSGAVLYTTNLFISPATYLITVGSGGAGGTGSGNSTSVGTNGGNSSITINGISYIAIGGGGGAYRNANSAIGTNGINGGSGGGGSHTNGITQTTGGSSIKNTYSGWFSLGNSGSKGISFNSNPNGKHLGGAGGGAGSSGYDAYLSADKNNGFAGVGGNGINLSSMFGTSVGQNGWFSGGGGGSLYGIETNTNIGFANGGNGLFGGGGNGSGKNGNSGINNTGGGGGAGGHQMAGGAGGSGVVIIRINKKTNSYIDNSSDCPVNLIPSGLINQIPDTNMNINVISTITRKNDFMYNQSFGNGNITYTITFSKYFNDEYIPTNLLLRNNKLTAFAIGNYNNGIFNRNINNGLNNYTEKGDFIHITLPSNITLKRYGFRADGSAVPRAPGSWVLYTGSRLLENTNVNKQLLASNLMKLDNNSYCQKNQFTHIQDIQTNGISGNELLFIFPSLAGSANVLSFMELLLYSS